MIKWSIDYVETSILRMLLYVIHGTSECEIKETLAYCGFYGLNILEDYMCTYVSAFRDRGGPWTDE
jgi:hypothetical protein